MTIQFYFIISPNNSGTTVMGQYLAEQCGGYLPPWRLEVRPMRLGAIVDEFGDGMKAVITIANPHMQIASCLKNCAKEPLEA